MTEQQNQSKIIKRYEKDGYFVIKLIKTNKNGIPDLLCLKSNESPLFIEVKKTGGVLSELQKYRIKELTDLNLKAIVLYE